MSQGARKWTAFAGTALALGLACVAGRWWVGESWTTVITLCCLEVLFVVAAVAGTRRVRRGR
ncbi:hypothetical protein [Streptomyces sp. NPDC004658]|uniref:hypothetical protein n=1 Tax=Streptomyces sp. NPDC004658 TaxID=3154672 RepID=UPI0033AF168E